MLELKSDLKPIAGPDKDDIIAIYVGAFFGNGREFANVIHKVDDGKGWASIRVRSVFQYLVNKGEYEKAIDFVLWKYSGVLAGAAANRSRINVIKLRLY